MNAHQDNVEHRRASFIAGVAADGKYRDPHRSSDASRRMRAEWRKAKKMIARMHRATRENVVTEAKTWGPWCAYVLENRLYVCMQPKAPPANDAALPLAEVIAFPITYQRHESACAIYNQASAIDEDYKRLDEAEALYKRAIALDPGLARAHTNLGNIAFKRNHTEEAVRLYKHALSLDDAQPEAHYNLGYVEMGHGLYAIAAKHFLSAVKRDPKFADAHFNLGEAYEELGRYAEARPCWETYLKLESTGNWADAARSRLNRRRS